MEAKVVGGLEHPPALPQAPPLFGPQSAQLVQILHGEVGSMHDFRFQFSKYTVSMNLSFMSSSARYIFSL